MGEVHLAERVDGELEQRVAVKLLRTGWPPQDSSSASGSSAKCWPVSPTPAIVPLLYGGTSGDGGPDLVLEYVDGLPTTEHLRPGPSRPLRPDAGRS